MRNFFFGIGHIILNIFFKIYLSLKIHGKINIPENEGVIIAPNQKSYLDPLLIFVALPLTSALRLYFTGALRHRKKRWLLWLLGEKIIFMKDILGLNDAMKKFSHLLASKNKLLIFPEGDWNPETKRMVPFRGGVGTISEMTGARIIPVYIHNSGIALPEGKYFLNKTRVEIYFDKPLAIPETLKRKYQKNSLYHLAISKLVKKRILILKKNILK